LPDVNEFGFRIHLGCGNIDLKGFINIDAVPLNHIHYRHPLDKLPMFKSNIADLVYASHCLEHFPHAKVKSIIKEWVRVLKPKGVLRLAVPDFPSTVKAYAVSGNQIQVIQGVLMGGQTYSLNFHQCAFDKEYLTELMREAGLVDISLWSPGVDEWSPSNDCSSASILTVSGTIPVSLNLQGRKP
jgi:predicted SAM-dependent methyltransferase